MAQGSHRPWFDSAVLPGTASQPAKGSAQELEFEYLVLIQGASVTHRPPNAMKSLRLVKNPTLRQRDLAALVGCSQSDVSAYETGRVLPDPRRIFEIAAALGSTVETVFFGEVEAALVRNAARLRTLQQAIPPTSLPDPATLTR